MEETKLNGVIFYRCDLTGATVHYTPMKGIDVRSCGTDGLIIDMQDLRGMIVTPLQAVELSRLLGVVIREEE